MRWQEEPECLRRQSAQGMELGGWAGLRSYCPFDVCTGNGSRWSSLVSQGLEREAMWCWLDGLHVSGRESDQGNPLRGLDRLEINRHYADPPATYLRSSFGYREVASEINRVSLVSSRGSWMNHYIPVLAEEALRLGYSLRWVHDHQQLVPGDVCFLLSYGRIVSDDWLSMHRHNLVVHASALPQGKGWSPMSLAAS